MVRSSLLNCTIECKINLQTLGVVGRKEEGRLKPKFSEKIPVITSLVPPLSLYKAWAISPHIFFLRCSLKGGKEYLYYIHNYMAKFRGLNMDDGRSPD